MRNKIQIAFDLGSYSIKSAVGRILPDGKIEVLSLAEIQSDSIDCGDIIDKDLLLSHLEILIEKMEKDAKINIDEDAWVSVSGRGIRSINSSTRIRSRENMDFDIDEEVKQKLLNQCSDVQVSSDRYVLHNIEQGYYIGSSPLIRNPIGMIGKSIDAKTHVIHVRNYNLTQLDHCFNEDLSIEPFPVFDGYAASSSNLTHDEKDLGVIFVDIGSDKPYSQRKQGSYLDDAIEEILDDTQVREKFIKNVESINDLYVKSAGRVGVVTKTVFSSRKSKKFTRVG